MRCEAKMREEARIEIASETDFETRTEREDGGGRSEQSEGHSFSLLSESSRAKEPKTHHSTPFFVSLFRLQST